MNARELNRKLRLMGACSEAVRWAEGKSFREVWNTCERADWMLWLCGRMAGTGGWPSRSQIVVLACDFAEGVLPPFEKKYPNDKRPHDAIKAAREWAQSGGAESLDTAKKARAAAADDAAAAAAAADDDAAAYAAAAAGKKRQEVLKELADKVRERLTVPD